MANPTPRIMILQAIGSNRDREAAFACELAGGTPEIVHVNQVAAGERRLLDAQMLVLPGGCLLYTSSQSPLWESCLLE